MEWYWDAGWAATALLWAVREIWSRLRSRLIGNAWDFLLAGLAVPGLYLGSDWMALFGIRLNRPT
eukprot:6259870-Amphidinium_carterae.1